MKRFFYGLIAVLTAFTLNSCVKKPPEKKLDSSFSMTAKVLNVGDLIEVEVIEAPYENTGIFWVITAEQTKYFGKDGASVKREELKVGDTVKIYYGGQVMMSYPPKIVAAKIELI